MGLFDDAVEVPRRTMVLFFLIDTSGSMKGEKIGVVNNTIDEVIPELKNISAANADAEIKIATLTFDITAEWRGMGDPPSPISAENFKWDYLDAQGITSFGEACSKLNEKLSRSEFMKDATGSFAPAIFLLSDGAPTDNYERPLNKLKMNNWFRKAIKVAISIGDDSIKKMLTEFTGSEESVITVHSGPELAKWIKFVSVRASEIGSKSSNASADNKDDNAPIPTKQDEFIEAIKEEKQNEEKKEEVVEPKETDDKKDDSTSEPKPEKKIEPANQADGWGDDLTW